MKTTFKKALSLAMILAMVVSTMVILPLTASAEDEADPQQIALAVLGGGTEEDPYVIDSKEDLMLLGNVGKDTPDLEIRGQGENTVVYMELACDIDMTGVTGFKSLKMKGKNNIIFDGKGHTISNLTVEDGYGGFWVAGLFGLLRGGNGTNNRDADNKHIGDTIKNIKMVNVNVNSNDSNQYVGGLIGEANSPLYMSDCSVTGSVTATTYAASSAAVQVGGLIGCMHQNYGAIVIENCVNEATVTSASNPSGSYVGGLVGGGYGLLTYEFNYCMNKGDLKALAASNSENPIHMGGMIGYTDDTHGVGDEPAQIFNNCANTGDMTIAAGGTANTMGGMIGSARSNSNAAKGAEMKMTNCYDYSARDFKGNVFGFNGAFAGFPASTATFTTFEYCYAVNKDGSTTPYEELCLEDEDATFPLEIYDSAIVATDATSIQLDGRNSTVAEEIATIWVAIICPGHEYGNETCGETCIHCGMTRKAPHAYANVCATNCSNCDQTRVAPHNYANDCDATCDSCGATRTVEGHKYLTSCSQFCSKCDEERPASELVHEYEDGACKNCGEPAPATEEATTTKPADTTTAAPAEEEKGCRGAINSTYAVLALVAVLGFAFVAKKREEN